MATVSDLQALVRDFNERRGWRRKHTATQLAMSIGIEAAEVMECLQWVAEQDARRAVVEDPRRRQALKEEVADVMIYLLALCDLCDIDLAAAVKEKLSVNEQRFPPKFPGGDQQ